MAGCRAADCRGGPESLDNLPLSSPGSGDTQQTFLIFEKRVAKVFEQNATATDRADEWPVRAHLREMLMLRAAELLGAAALIFFQVGAQAERMPVTVIVLCLLALYASTWIIFLHLQQQRPLSGPQMTGHLLIDVGVLALLLYTASGTTNPFAVLYLPVVVLAAAMLRAQLLLWVVGASIASYGVLVFFHHDFAGDVADPRHRAVEFGTWIALSMVVAFVAFFVYRLSRIAREQQKLEQIASEKSHRDEALISLAALAAGTAHELNTPLSTMAVIVDEMRHWDGIGSDERESVALLARQIDACRAALKDMVVAASADHFEGARAQPVIGFLDGVMDRFRFLRPGVPLAFHYERLDENDQVIADKTLEHSLINLINNAADASPGDVEVRASSEDGRLYVDVRDRGPGVPPSIREQLGRPFFTTKGARPGAGSGVGLFITNRTVESFGGTVMMYQRAGGGTCVSVSLPLQYRNESGGVHGRSISAATASAVADPAG
jgi:two-component system, sensor histidine kinase RegB